MKRTIRLTESELKHMISECVKRALNEGGHLYHKDENGNIMTNSKETYRGVHLVQHIFGTENGLTQK